MPDKARDGCMPDKARDRRNVALNYQVNCWCTQSSKETILLWHIHCFHLRVKVAPVFCYFILGNPCTAGCLSKVEDNFSSFDIVVDLDGVSP